MQVRSRLFAISFFVVAAQSLHAGDDLVQFDVPPYLQASKAENAGVVDIQITVSSFIQDAKDLSIEQWIIKVQPRDSVTISDYAPKTNASSETEGGIKIKQTNEITRSLGLGLNSDLAHFADASFGVDRGLKELSSREYSMLSPVQTVTASGTINRGRGVYFKWRRTPNQVLDGDKTFSLALQVDKTWCGSLLDISIVAHARRRAFGTLDQGMAVIGRSHFAVPVFPAGNVRAKDLAKELTRAECTLRELANHSIGLSTCEPSLSSILHSVASKLEFDSQQNDMEWLDRLVNGRADAYLDEKIAKLPMDLRRAAIHYQKRREQFLSQSSNDSAH